MKKILKAKLYKKRLAVDIYDYNAQVILNGNIGITEIVDELITENNDLSREAAINLINSFNQKVAEKVVSGYQVNSGLVRLSPVIKGYFNDKKWNPILNRIDISISQGYELNSALSETCIELHNDKNDTFEFIDPIEQSRKHIENSQKHEEKNSLVNTSYEPACGIAFRRWLCEA
jgi:hypothetical protein